MWRILLQRYENISPGFVLDPGVEFSTSTREKALAAGCELMVVAEIKAEKFQSNFYTVSLNQKVYRVKDGELVSETIYSSETRELTPMEALVSIARTMEKESSPWVNAHWTMVSFGRLRF